MAESDGRTLKRLEEDFNNGDPLELEKFKEVLSQASMMGFSTSQALEAALVCNISDSNIASSLEQMTEYLFLDTQSQRKQYEARKKECQKDIQIPPNKLKLIDEIKRIQAQVDSEKEKQKNLLAELDERSKVKKVDKYADFLRGIVADEKISDREQMALDAYRKYQKVSDEEHGQALKMIDLDDETLADYRKNPADGGKKCVLCKDGPKEFVIYNCMHVCVCEPCSEKLKDSGGPGGGCPVCGEEIDKLEKVFAD